MKASQQDQPNPRGGHWPAALPPPRQGQRFLALPLAMLLFLVLFVPALPAVAETLFTTQTPQLTDQADGRPYELGMKFQSAVAGPITAIRYWKALSEPAGNHVGRIWDALGNPLASVTFANETASGWQQQALTTPLQIQPGTTYVVSVNVATHYVATVGGLTSAVVNGNLSSVAGTVSPNGVFGNPGIFPTGSFNNTNYFRDVVFGEPAQAGKCIVGEKYVSVTGPGGPFVRNSVTVNGGALVPPENLNDLPMAIFGGTKVFYQFVIKNCGTVDLYNVRLDDCIDQRSVGDNGFLVGGANGSCVEDPRLIPASPQRIVATKLRPGESKTVTSADFDGNPFLLSPISSVDICERFGRIRTDGIVRNDSEAEADADLDGNGVGETFVSFDDLNLVQCKPPPGIKITKYTNGIDGDDANGLPTPALPTGSLQTGFTVAEVAPNGSILWTYRVTNTGKEALTGVQVTDDRGVPVTCPKDTLAVGESMDCTASGVAQSLTDGTPNVPGCGSGGTNTRPTYANKSIVNAVGAVSNTQVSANNPSHYCNPTPPVCDLTLNKTCEIVQPTGGPALTSCKGKLQNFTLIWPTTGGTINISGIGNNATGGLVRPGQRVTFTGPWTTNDLFLSISGAQSGQSTFHVSCSDDDMDGENTNAQQEQVSPQGGDCGKFEGNGKNKTGFINTWLLDGLVDAEGKVLKCSSTPTTPTNSCSFQAQDPPSCGTGGTAAKPTTLTFQYTGGGCSTESNNQAPDKTSCTGRIDPALPVTVTASAGGPPVPSSVVQPGGTFTINRAAADTTFTLTNLGGTETDKIHTSCSQPLAVGDVYFSLTLVAEDGVGTGKDVKYSYKVTNTGTGTATGISVTDDKLGAIGSIASLNPGDTNAQTLTKNALIGQTTTNVATATGSSCPSPGVKATATVTVLPPPPCSVSQTFDTVEDDKYKVKLTNNGKKVATLDELVLDWPVNATYNSIKEVKLDGGIYQQDKSNLLVTSGVPIEPDNWTNADVTKRQLDPGETRTLEIVFKQKWPKANCPGGNCFSGTASFAQGCEVDLSP